MKEINLSVAVDDFLYDYVGDVYLAVEMNDEMYDALSSLVSEYRYKGEKLTVEDFWQKLPEVYKYIDKYVDSVMPDEVDLDEELDIDDFSWSIKYPEDICELIDEE